MIIFHRLPQTSLFRIVDKMLGELRQRLQERQLALELTDAARGWLVERGFDEAYGARPLRRLIQREVENVLARRVLANEFVAGDTILVDVDGAGLAFSRQPATSVPETVPVPLSP